METLHNNVTLKQIDEFLIKMTNFNVYNQRQTKRNIQVTPYDSDVDQLQSINDLNEIAIAKKSEPQDRKTSGDLQSNKSSISGLSLEQPILIKANTISSSSTLTSNLSDISDSSQQLQVSGPSSIISSCSMPSSPNNLNNSFTHLEFCWKKTFFHNSIDNQSDNDQATTSFSGPSSPLS